MPKEGNHADATATPPTGRRFKTPSPGFANARPLMPRPWGSLVEYFFGFFIQRSVATPCGGEGPVTVALDSKGRSAHITGPKHWQERVAQGEFKEIKVFEV